MPQPRVWRRPVRLTSAAREHGQLPLLRGVAGRTRACRLGQHLLHGARAEPVVPLQLGLPATVCTDRSGRWALRRRAGRSGSWTAAATDCWLAWLGHGLELGCCLRRGGDGLQHVHADGSEGDAVEQLEGDFSGGRHPPWTPLAGRPTQLHRAETGVQQKKFDSGGEKKDLSRSQNKTNQQLFPNKPTELRQSTATTSRRRGARTRRQRAWHARRPA